MVVASSKAAIELNYFDIFEEEESLVLEWSTASENDVSGFEVYCKEEDEPISAYHLIGSRIAQGNQQQGAVYRLNLKDGIEPATSYCFRLREITIDNQVGEIIDRCGYGLNITPTPSSTPTLAITPTLGITATLSLITPTVTAMLPITLTVAPTITPTNTATIEASSIITDQNSDLATETATATLLPTATATATETTTPTEEIPPPPTSPLPTPQPTATSVTNSPLVPTVTVTATETDQITTTTLALQEEREVPDEVILPNPAYIVLTSTPIPAAIPIEPTFTPYPTALVTSESNLIATVFPNSQSLMFLLLCGVFSGASGLGILGLVTTLLYMRSRTVDRHHSHRIDPMQKR